MHDLRYNISRKVYYSSFLRITGLVLFVLVVLLVSAYIGLNFFGERFLKKFMETRIRKESHGLYTLDFDKFRFNFFTGEAEITHFHLIPDETLFNRLKAEGKVSHSLYSISYEKLTLNKLKLREIYFDRIIHIRQADIDRMVIGFVALADSAEETKGRFKRVYEDIYPALSTFFKQVRIDSIIVNESSFSGVGRSRQGLKIEGDWKFSAVLRDFYINTGEFYRPDRIFYSQDVELRINDFQYSLADSLYFLEADEIGFSLMDSRLFGKGLRLIPNFSAKHPALNHAGNFYRVYLPAFSLDGVDVYRALQEQEIQIRTIGLEELNVSMYRNKPLHPEITQEREQVNMASLFTIFEKKLKFLTIDSFIVRNATFQFFPSPDDSAPEMKVDRASVALGGFYLDSLAHLDTAKILYSRDIALDLSGFTLSLRDKLHDLNAQQVNISTRESRIEIRNATLMPSVRTDPAVAYEGDNFYMMLFPEVSFSRINLLRFFNSKKLEFEKLNIQEPDVKVIQYRTQSVPEDTVSDGETFLNNLDLFSDLIIPYMISFRADTLEISNAYVRFLDNKNGYNEQRISGLVEMRLTGVSFDSLTYIERKSFLNRLELEMKLTGFRYVSPDSLHRLSLNSLNVSSPAGKLEVKGFSLVSTSSGQPAAPIPSTLDISFDSLEITGFNHRKWINEKWFVANEIRLSNPSVQIRSFRRKKESTLNEPFAGTEERIKKIALNNILIRQGHFDLEEEETGKKGALRLTQFDFQLSGFLFDLTGWKQGIKILKYDFLALYPHPDHPLILNHEYSVCFSGFTSASSPPDFSVNDLHVKSMEKGKDITGPFLEMDVFLPSFRIIDLDLGKALFNRELLVGEIRVRDPAITLVRHTGRDTLRNPEKTKINTRPGLHSPFHSMEIGKFDLAGGKLDYTREQPDTTTRLILDRISATIREFNYDSVKSTDPDAPLLYCGDIDLTTGGYSMVTRDSMYTVSISGIHLSTGQSLLEADSFALIPNYSAEEFSRRTGYQTNRIGIRTGNVQFRQIDFFSLLEERKLIAGKAVIDQLTLENYRDKRMPFPHWKRPPMIQPAIRKISFPLSIDTISLNDGKLIYREQNEEDTGMIMFDRLNLTLMNFTNDPAGISEGALLTVKGSAWFMGEALIEGEFRFPMKSENDTFYFRGKTEQVDMKLFNPVLSQAFPVRIRSGFIDSLNVQWMRGNQFVTNGILDLYYHDLRLELIHVKQDFWSKLGTDLLQVVVDLAVPTGNEGSFGKHRTGYILNRRDEERGYFNYFWRSIVTGLKASEGIMSEEQREFKKEMAKEK